jgi:aminoglycoside/choline kinase family phosphotransferase
MSGSDKEAKVTEAVRWALKVAWPKKKPGWVSIGGNNMRAMMAVPLSSDASDRDYHRVKMGQDHFILMVGPDLQENLLWRDYGEKLGNGGLPVPKFYTRDENRGFYMIEDLGEERLDRLADLYPQNQRVELYADVMEVLANWHNKAYDLVKDSPYFDRNPEYNLEFVRHEEWEYFLDGLIFLLDLEDDDLDWASLEVELESILKIPDSPPVLIHRDFQSRNLMCFEDKFYILDWQGARVGPAAYDLASILYDPYVNLTDKERKEFLKIYLEHRSEPDLEKSLAQLVPIRLMQTIGAYCYLHKKGLPYGQYLYPALTRLDKALTKGKNSPKLLKGFIKKAIDIAEKLCPERD